VTLSHVQELLQRIQQLEGAQVQTGNEKPKSQVYPCADETPISVDADGEDDSLQPSRAAISGGRLAFDAQSPSSIPNEHPARSGHVEGSEVFPLGNHMGLNWFFNGIPIFSERGRQWVSSRTGQAVQWSSFRILSASPSPFSGLYPQLSQEELYTLPDKDLVQSILAVFFGSSLRLIFPLLDQVLMEETVETAYEPIHNLPFPPSHVSARACVLAALSVVCRLRGSKYLSNSIEADLCAHKAPCLRQRITSHVSLETLQTALLLVRLPSCTAWVSSSCAH
jgi:hypothetical protein